MTSLARLLPLVFLTAVPLAAETTIDTILVTASRLSGDGSDGGSSLSAVDRDALARVGHTHVSEALARVPGVWISRGNGQEHLTAIRSPVLTGPGSCGAFFVAEDGIPLRAPGFCNVNQLFDANTEQAAAIEVLRGPGLALHGGNALNGVINILSAAPGEAGSGSIRAEYGANAYRRLAVTASSEWQEQRMRLSAHGNRDNGYKADSGYDQQKLSLRVTGENEQWEHDALLSVSNLNQETAGFVQGFKAYANPDLQESNPNPEAYRDSRSARARLQLARSTANGGRLLVTPYLRATEMAFRQHFLPGTPLEENRHHSVGLQTAFYRETRNGIRLHNGFDLDLTQASLEQRQDRPGFAVFPTGQHYDYTVDAVNAAWFLGADWHKGATRWRAGARYELQLYEYDNRMATGALAEDGSTCSSSGSPAPCRYSRPADRSDRFANLGWHLSASRRLFDTVDARLAIGHGFRAPQATELYRLQAGQLRADLDSEEITQLDLGFSGQSGSIDWELVFYAARKNNVILQDSNRANAARGKTRHRGIDIDVRWALGEHWQLQWNGAVSSHQYDNDVLPDRLNPSQVASVKGRDMDTAPRQQGSTRLLWQPGHGFSAELEWQYLGKYYLEPTNSRAYSGHELFNLRARQSFGPAWLAMRWLNIGNKDYAERADFAFGNYRYFVGEPRRLFVEAGLEF